MPLWQTRVRTPLRRGKRDCNRASQADSGYDVGYADSRESQGYGRHRCHSHESGGRGGCRRQRNIYSESPRRNGDANRGRKRFGVATWSYKTPQKGIYNETAAATLDGASATSAFASLTVN
jgi:hypothetical protein